MARGRTKSTTRRSTRRVLFAPDYYIHEAHEGLIGFAKQAGWVVDARASRGGDLPIDWQADGILTFIAGGDIFGPILRATGLPIVNMSPWLPELKVPTVVMDNFAAGKLAAEHLIGCCLTHLAMVQFTPRSITSSTRRRGFETTVREAGRGFHSIIIDREDLPRREQIALMGAAIKRLPRPVGIFTEGDDWAVEVIYVCEELGLSVPRDVAVIGVDNDPLVVEATPVPVSSVDNNLYALGYQAAALLERLMNGEPPPAEPIMIPPIGVAQRNSTSTLAASHDEVEAALLFIHSNFREPITVADVASELTISRRRLQDLFVRHVGRTVSQEITRHRLNLAKQMLHESQTKVGVIAERCGFGSHSRLTKVFARVLKTTPGEFRQERPDRGN